MNFEDLPVGSVRLRVRRTDGSNFDEYFDRAVSPRVTAITPSILPGVFDLALVDTVAPVSPVEDSRVRAFNLLLGTGRTILSELADPAADGSVELRIAFFVGPIIDMDELEIGVDEYIEQQVGKFGRSDRGDARQWLAEDCTMSVGGESFFLVAAGPAIEDDLASFERTDLRATLSNSFCVTGRTTRFVATSTPIDGGAEIFVVSKLTWRREGSDGAIRLARGRLRFTDWTRTGQIKILARAQLEHLTTDKSSYLRRWDEYLDLEGEHFLRETREFGVLDYSAAKFHKDGTASVHIDRASEDALARLAKMGDRDELSYVDELPNHLVDSEMTFSQFCAELRRGEKAELIAGRKDPIGLDRLGFVTWNQESKTLRIKAEALPPDGRLVLATKGNTAQIKRRLEAREAVLHGRTANPQLGLLIEDGGQPTSLRSPQHIKALSAFVRDKVFKNPPTPMQERAIEVALNTPDIALIQGPPGTGKTTVIAAILERLNELSVKDGVIRAGDILLTGFQQDAVENLIDRISLNGLPVPKFGIRAGSTETNRGVFEARLAEWCNDIAGQLRERNPQIARHEEEREVQDLYAQYLRVPSRRLATVLLRRLSRLGPGVVDEDLAGNITALLQHLSTRELLATEQDRFLPAVRRLRTSAEAFADDGPQRAADAAVDLAEVVDETQAKLLRRASSWTSDRGDPPFLLELAGLKRSLLHQLTAPPVFRVEKHNAEVLEVTEAAIRCVHEKGLSAIDRKTAALVGFLSELENDPKGMIDAVSAYSYAYSATVQQSVIEELRRRKREDDPDQDPSGTLLRYEYVIVDEAARVAPPDLMIALAQGKKIILVGDHRQLPHMIEDRITREIDTGDVGLDETDWLKKSMFEHLFADRLKVLEERDGIQRRVTLDKQFRMHPVLGDFVSRTFYERNDIIERFGSGLPAEAFTHDLPGTRNKPALWIEVPGEAGPAIKDGTPSYFRRAEIDAIARQLEDWLGSPEGRDLSYGIISFYGDQAKKIQEELKARFGDGTVDGRRIRVGTVDSFQGMEFDVVFLSVVRTAPQNRRTAMTDSTREARAVFGHLCLSNRLNVSMSRQKRLLVAVGDPALVEHPLASEFIPGLVEFRRLAMEG